MDQHAGMYRALCSGGRVPVSCGILSRFIPGRMNPTRSGRAFSVDAPGRLGDHPTQLAAIRARPRGIAQARKFERGYANRSRFTLSDLREFKRYVFPCTCGYSGCGGWQMAYIDNLESWEVETWPAYWQKKYKRLVQTIKL